MKGGMKVGEKKLGGGREKGGEEGRERRIRGGKKKKAREERNIKEASQSKTGTRRGGGLRERGRNFLPSRCSVPQRALGTPYNLPPGYSTLVLQIHHSTGADVGTGWEIQRNTQCFICFSPTQRYFGR